MLSQLSTHSWHSLALWKTWLLEEFCDEIWAVCSPRRRPREAGQHGLQQGMGRPGQLSLLRPPEASGETEGAATPALFGTLTGGDAQLHSARGSAPDRYSGPHPLNPLKLWLSTISFVSKKLKDSFVLNIEPFYRLDSNTVWSTVLYKVSVGTHNKLSTRTLFFLMDNLRFLTHSTECKHTFLMTILCI